MPQAKKYLSRPNILKNALYLNEQGIGVVRFWSNDVLQQTDSVLQALWQEVHLPSPQPLSQRERGLEEPSLSHE
jgi:very-short-patch-repair endonuclease